MPTVPLWGADRSDGWVFENFASLDTRTPRVGIEDNNFSWVENLIPLAHKNLRCIYDNGAPIYTASGGRTIVYYYFFNLKSVQYVAVFLSDGSAVQVNVLTSAVTTIAAAGTFYSSGNIPACAQWQSKYLLIVSTVSQNGYWCWDGTFLYQSGTLSPDITLTNPGLNYTSAPTITAYGGAGSGSTFTATVNNGVVTDVTMTGGGSGYAILDQVQLAFSGGGSDDQAYGHATLATTNGISAVNVTHGGTGYSSTSTVVFTGGSGSGATAAITQIVNGSIVGVTVYNPGTGYTSPPSVSFGSGSGATATATIKFGQLASIVIDYGGSGYTGDPTVTIGSPTALGVGNTQATATATITSGSVSGATINNPGLGYLQAPNITFTGGNNAATATVKLFPFGLQGNTIETYQQRVWIGNVTKSYFSAAPSISDFATSDGGGAFPATDSSLRAQIVRYAQANGFLYGFGDSSVFVISNVQTSGSPPTTNFNNSNVDPQIGAAWPGTVVSFGRALVFANSTGVYALYGGAAEKVSTQLDNLFLNADFTTVTPTASVATIYETRVYCLNFRTVDYAGQTRNILALWDGQRWFLASQTIEPTLISTQEVSSNLTTWGSDGSSIYPLFKAPTDKTGKIYQTRLRYEPSHVFTKQMNAVYLVVNNNDSADAYFNMTVDTEGGSVPIFTGLTFVGTGPIYIYGTGPIMFFPVENLSPGLNFVQGSTSAFGYSYGMTFTSNAKDITVVSTTLLFVPKYAAQG